jgi:N-acetylmuramoyl-L-alanine amidase
MLVAAPPIDVQHIDMNAKRRGEMRAYSKRHYGYASARLKPRVIVEHIAVAKNARAVIDTFAPDVPDRELGELPGLCAHYLVTGRGRILELVSPKWRCRHTVGLNHVAIGIEHVGMEDGDVLDHPKRLKASLRLTAYLRCRYDIPLGDVIGHSESLDSPYHRERVKRLRRQTHADWSHASMKVYRRRLARIPCEAAG